MYDVIIIGAGPAGLSAGWYACKQKLKTLVISQTLANCEPVVEFNRALTEDRKYLELELDSEVVSLDKNIVSFSIETKQGRQYYAQSVVIAAGCTGTDGNTAFDRVTQKDALGKVVVDANLQSNVPGIFAVGDVAVTLAKGTASAILEGAKAALTLDKILQKGYNRF